MDALQIDDVAPSTLAPTYPLIRYIPLPIVPTDAMLLDLALSRWWDDTPGETRDDFVQAYQRMQDRLPSVAPGYFLAPDEPDEALLLAIAGLDKFVTDEEDGVCLEFEMTYEGYKAMLFGLKSAA